MVGQRMSYPLCYHNPMMKMKEQLFKVRIALWRKNDAFRETHIRAYDLDHAKRISNAKFGTLGVTVEPAKPFGNLALCPALFGNVAHNAMTPCGIVR